MEILNASQKDYLDGLRNEPDELIKEMETFAAENKVPILSSDSADFLELMIRMFEPERVLEIGTAIAYSSIRIAKKLKKKSLLHTIEKSEDNIIKAKEYISKSGVKDKIRILKGNAEDLMPLMEKKYDFIFLDADKEDYLRLFEYSMILLRKDGVMFVDNLLWHGYAAAEKVPASHKKSTEQIREFNKIFMNHKNLKSVIIPVGDGIGLGIKLGTKK
jgi:caffeoyl-CoA O-methyltransferase